MTPQVGDIVLFELAQLQADHIKRVRIAWLGKGAPTGWPPGAQAHVGSEAKAGDLLPFLVVKVSEAGQLSGKVMLDGNDCMWQQFVSRGDGPGQWRPRPSSPAAATP